EAENAVTNARSRKKRAETIRTASLLTGQNRQLRGQDPLIELPDLPPVDRAVGAHEDRCRQRRHAIGAAGAEVGVEQRRAVDTQARKKCAGGIAALALSDRPQRDPR